MRRYLGPIGAGAVLLSAAMLTAPVTGQAGQAGRGAQAPRPEDNRPPVFFREEWKHQFDRGGPPEGPVGPEHVSHPDLELKHYGEAPKGDPGGRQEHTHAGMWMNKRFANDPAHLFTGIYCVQPEFIGRIPPAQKLSVVPIFHEMIRAGTPPGGVVVDEGVWRDLGTRDE